MLYRLILSTRAAMRIGAGIWWKSSRVINFIAVGKPLSFILVTGYYQIINSITRAWRLAKSCLSLAGSSTPRASIWLSRLTNESVALLHRAQPAAVRYLYIYKQYIDTRFLEGCSGGEECNGIG